jgi:formylglycine-generating enzyme required for sulfatase activity
MSRRPTPGAWAPPAANPSRELRPTVRGAFDLHGNLYEWTHGWRIAFSESAVTDPHGPKEGSFRMSRGGSWGVVAGSCRSSRRDSYDPTFRSIDRGFRLALSSPSRVSSPAEQGQDAGAEPAGVGTEEGEK